MAYGEQRPLKQDELCAVCFVVTSIALAGGNERDVVKSIHAFGKRGRIIHVIAAFVRDGVKESLAQYNIVWHDVTMPLVRPPFLSQLLFYVQAKKHLASLKSEFSALPVISFEPNPLASYWVGASPRSLWLETRKKFGFLPSVKPGLALWSSFAEKKLVNHAQKILVYSERASQRLVSMGVDASRLHKVIIPTDTEYFCPDALNVVNNRNELLLVGENPRLKGVDTMLQAWPEIHRLFPDLTLRLVCKGWKVRRLVKKFNLANVVVSPFISDPRQYYAQARLVLMPSVFESWGNVTVEAIACGVPVVVSSLVPTSEVCNQKIIGSVFPRTGDDDVNVLTKAIIEQLSITDFSDRATQFRHHHIVTYQQTHLSSVEWLLKNV